MTLQKTLTALYNNIIIGFALYGCGVTGMPIPKDLEEALKNTP